MKWKLLPVFSNRLWDGESDMHRQRVPDIWKQVAAVGARDDAARDFLLSVMLAEASDPDQCLGRYKSVYEKLLEDTMLKLGRRQ
jgi:hypothetical protein